MDNEMGAPETKAELNEAFGEFMGAFETFRETNDRRLAELEKKGADVLTVEKLARVEAALDFQQRRMDEMVLRGARPSLMGGAPVVANEQKSAFNAFVRSGDEQAMRSLEKKAMTADGGLAMPIEVEAEVMRRLGRDLADPVDRDGPLDLRDEFPQGGPERADRRVGHRNRGAHGRYGDAEGAELSDDGALRHAGRLVGPDRRCGGGCRSWLADEIEMVFAEQETQGVRDRRWHHHAEGYRRATPAPLRTATSRPRLLGVIKTGQDGSFPNVAPSDALVDLVYSVKASYRQNASLRDEPQHAGAHPQAEGWRGRVSVDAAVGSGRPCRSDELPDRGSRGHAGLHHHRRLARSHSVTSAVAT